MESRGMRREGRMKYCTYKSIQGDEYMSTSFIEQVHYNRIPVKDLELSAHWYRDILGLQLLSHNEELAILKTMKVPPSSSSFLRGMKHMLISPSIRNKRSASHSPPRTYPDFIST